LKKSKELYILISFLLVLIFGLTIYLVLQLNARQQLVIGAATFSWYQGLENPSATGTFVFEEDKTFVLELTVIDQYVTEKNTISGTWAVENSRRVIKSFTSIVKEYQDLGLTYLTVEYTDNQALGMLQQMNLLSLIDKPISAENDKMICLMEWGIFVKDAEYEENEVVFLGGYFRLIGLDFDIYIPNGDISFLEEQYTEFLLLIYAMTPEETEEFSPVYQNITFSDTIDVEEDPHYGTISASLILPGETEVVERTFRCCLFSDDDFDVFVNNIFNPNRIEFNGFNEYARVGTTINEYIADMKIKLYEENDEDEVSVTADMISGYPTDPEFEGFATLIFSYEDLTSYELVYFFPSEYEVLEHTIAFDFIVDAGYNLNHNILFTKGDGLDLTSAPSSVSFDSGNDLDFKFYPSICDVPISECTYVSGLTFNDVDEIQNDAGAYLVTLNYALDNIVFDFDIVIVIVDPEDTDVNYITSFEIEGDIIGTYIEVEDKATYDLNGAKLLVYSNFSDTPVEVDLTEEMIQDFLFEDYEIYMEFTAKIVYTYTYLGKEYNVVYAYTFTQA